MNNNISSLALHAVHRANDPAAESQKASPMVRKLFILMHGNYGTLFLAKFSTGEKDAAGHDKGIRAAMRVWDSRLQRFAQDVVHTAAGRLAGAHPSFPPSLPEFELLCEAVAPRQTYAEENNLPRLAAPAPAAPVELVDFKPRGDMKDWARRLLARHDAGEVLRPLQLRFAREALGIKVQGGAA